MAFYVTLLVVRLVGLSFAVLWTIDQFAWWKLVLVGFGVALVWMQVRKVQAQEARDRARRGGTTVA